MTKVTGRRARAGALLAAVVTATAFGTGTAQADGPGVGTPTVVSVGDSYISGEAGRWAGNTNNGSQYVDALGSTAYYDNASNTAEAITRCHRSKAAEIVHRRRRQQQEPRLLGRARPRPSPTATATSSRAWTSTRRRRPARARR